MNVTNFKQINNQSLLNTFPTYRKIFNTCQCNTHKTLASNVSILNRKTMEVALKKIQTLDAFLKSWEAEFALEEQKTTLPGDKKNVQIRFRLDYMEILQTDIKEAIESYQELHRFGSLPDSPKTFDLSQRLSLLKSKINFYINSDALNDATL